MSNQIIHTYSDAECAACIRKLDDAKYDFQRANMTRNAQRIKKAQEMLDYWSSKHKHMFACSKESTSGERQECLNKLAKAENDLMLAKQTPENIKEAQAMVKYWQAKPDHLFN